MIDLHCHILPGVDDGPADFATALRMASLAAEDGIRQIVATPHVRESRPDPFGLKTRAAQLNEVLIRKGIPVRILLGGDVSVSVALQEAKLYTLNASRYLLVEFPHTHLPANAADILFGYALQGISPIITHPERNLSILANPSKLISLYREKVYVQITGGSLLGEFGEEERHCAIFLLRSGLVDFISSDGHSPDYRKPVLAQARKVAGKILGGEKGDKLVFENPARVLANEDL